MKPIENFTVRHYDNTKLPVGGYVVKILNANVCEYDWGSVLILQFDIDEGDYAGFFREKYNNRFNEDDTWKGTARITIPDESSKYYKQNKIKFSNTLYAIEQSNPGYHWDWSEAGLKNKLVGVLFGNNEWEYNGKTGWSVKPRSFVSIDDIRSNNFTVPKDLPLKNKTTDNTFSTSATATDNNVKVSFEDDDDLPF